MNPWNALLDLQALDTTLVQLEHRAAQLPERVALTEVEAELVSLRHRISAVEGDQHVVAKDMKRIEDEVALLEDKIVGAERHLYGDGSSNAKELQAYQDEIAGFRRRIADLEDEELALMEQLEPIEASLAALAGTKAELDERAIALTAQVAVAEADLNAERTSVGAMRADLAGGIDPGSLAEYERVRARLGGVAVARLEAGVCGACHLKLSAVEVDRILHLPADEAVTCEDCGRFLVRD